MGHEFQIDVDALKMFHGYEWVDFGSPCQHDCPHNAQSTCGWGPTTATYELIECDRCGCRGWLDGRSEQRGADARWWKGQIEWFNPVAALGSIDQGDAR